MLSHEEIQHIAAQVIENEANAIKNLLPLLNEDFTRVVRLMLDCPGNVVFSGIGKSALIAQKIVATMNSTGTSSRFLHAADALHGDLGMLRSHDVVVLLSKSGETPEIKVLVPLVKLRGNPIVAITGRRDSYLAKQADYLLDVTVENEGFPGNPAPTCSATAQLVMGDALALALMKCRGFSTDDFAQFHPGGALGKQLYLRVSDLYKNNEKPEVGPDDALSQVIIEMTRKRLGAAVVTGEGPSQDAAILGIITDGDLRRTLLKHPDIEHVKAKEVMTPNPKTIGEDDLVADALQKMRANSITQLPVLKDGRYVGVIHLHDILKEGIL